MALSQEQENKVNELYDQFEEKIREELKSNFTTSNVKTVIHNYVGKLRTLYYRNEIDKEINDSLTGKLFALSGELQKEAAEQESKNINNPLEKNQFIDEPRFQKLKETWLRDFEKELTRLEKRSKDDPSCFTHEALINYYKGFLTGEVDPLFDDIKQLLAKKALSNKMQKELVDGAEEIVKKFLPKVTHPSEATERTNGTMNREKVENEIKEKFEKIKRDLIDNAENTLDNLRKEVKEKLVPEIDKLYKSKEINESDKHYLIEKLNEWITNNSNKFSVEAYRRARKNLVKYADKENEFVKEKDFEDDNNELDTNGILYATTDNGRIKKGFYKIHDAFVLLEQYMRSYDFDNDPENYLPDFKEKRTNDKLNDYVELKNRIRIFYSKDLAASINKKKKRGNLYHLKGDNDYFYTKELCFRNKYENFFELCKTKNKALLACGIKKEEEEKPKKEVESHDSLVHLKFKFEDGTIIECLDSENKSRDEVLAEAKKVYEQMKRSR